MNWKGKGYGFIKSRVFSLFWNDSLCFAIKTNSWDANSFSNPQSEDINCCDSKRSVFKSWRHPSCAMRKTHCNQPHMLVKVPKRKKEYVYHLAWGIYQQLIICLDFARNCHQNANIEVLKEMKTIIITTNTILYTLSNMIIIIENAL